MVERSNRTLYNYDIADALREAGALPPRRVKRLRRLPHLFCRQLELPVAADSPVQVEESHSSFIFKVTLPPPLPDLDRVSAQVIHIVPGVTTVSVAGVQVATAHFDENGSPLWRFRLPDSCIPEASVASCDADGLLTLTIPKPQSEQGAPYSLIHTADVNFGASVSLPDFSPGENAHIEISSFLSQLCASVGGFVRDSMMRMFSPHQQVRRRFLFGLCLVWVMLWYSMSTNTSES
ncbi:hypothetical protein KP509_26G065300 [Ceratopteris richardii]|uniref:SHSP domain-containing protein n=1 Tax=Ceratopteris richardii TaxID=49495 RepID=A0A8T2RLS9_CERRI|nr:hypothetical protein KP509_26G065300 [Ceratopteris richardii]